VRLPGQIIWATRVEAVRTSTRSGGKGGSGGTATESVSYYANVALGLCEGPVARIGRIWADGKEIDAGAFTFRLHTGAEDQAPDPLIVAKEGSENAPAYRGLAYVVFERMPLGDFGNRVPQLHFEVIRPAGRLESAIRSVCMIRALPNSPTTRCRSSACSGSARARRRTGTPVPATPIS